MTSSSYTNFDFIYHTHEPTLVPLIKLYRNYYNKVLQLLTINLSLIHNFIYIFY